MKKIFIKSFALIGILLLAGQAYAGLITISFDGVGDLENSVFGFQANYDLKDASGVLQPPLGVTDYTIYFTKYFNGSEVVNAPGAVPGTDMSVLGIDPTTDWDIGPIPSSSGVIGYTLGTAPLVTGTLLSLMVPEGLTLEFTCWQLSDDTGDPATFIFGRNVFAVQDGDNIIITSAVPIPGAFILLGSGLFGLLAIRRRRT